MVAEAHFPTGNGLVDKQRWHELYDESVSAAQASGQPISVIFIDINNFKRVNDELGHQQGDNEIAAFQNLVSEVMGTLRTDSDRDEKDIITAPDEGSYIQNVPDPETVSSWADYAEGKGPGAANVVGQIGGDEIAILAYTDAAGAEIITQRVRDAATDYLNQPANAHLKKLDVGLAIGSASLEPNLDGGSEVDPGIGSKLLAEADRAMYKDKLRQLRDLDPEELERFKEAIEKLKAANIRPRQFLNYLRKYFDQEVSLELDESAKQ